MSTLPLSPPSSLRARSRMTWRRTRRNPVSFAALSVIALIALAAILAPLIAPYGPDEPDAAAALGAPSWHHWLGTDMSLDLVIAPGTPPASGTGNNYDKNIAINWKKVLFPSQPQAKPRYWKFS